MRGKDLLECMEYIDDALIEEALEPAAFPHRTGMAAKWGMAAACLIAVGISATAFWSHQNIKDEQTEQIDESMAAQIAMDNTACFDDSGSTSTTSSAGNGMTTGASEAGMQKEAAETARDEAAIEDMAADAVSSQKNLDIAELEAEETAKLKYIVIDDYYGEQDSSVYDGSIPEKGEILCSHDLQKTMEYYAEQEKTTAPEDDAIYAYDVVIDVYGDIEVNGNKDIQYEKLNIDDIDTANAMIEQEYRRLIELGYAVRLSEDFQLTGTLTKVEIDTFQSLPEYGYVFRFADE